MTNSYSSVGWKSDVGLTGWKSGCWQGCFPSEASRKESVFSSASRLTCYTFVISWSFSSIFKARNTASAIPVLSSYFFFWLFMFAFCFLVESGFHVGSDLYTTTNLSFGRNNVDNTVFNVLTLWSLWGHYDRIPDGILYLSWGFCFILSSGIHLSFASGLETLI